MHGPPEEEGKGRSAGRLREWLSLPRLAEGNYPANLAVAIVALSPFIIVSTASMMYARQVQAGLGMGRFADQLIAGLAIAAYAFGALSGGDMVQRFRQRRLFLVAESAFVAACVLCALAPSPFLYGAGRILSGGATGVLLVTALPPVVREFPVEKLKITVRWVNIGFFGAVCAGPLVGGAVAALHGWRWFYAILGLVGLINLVGAMLALPLRAPMNPKLRFDIWAVTLGLPAVALPFWAASELNGHGFLSALFILPLAAGLGCFAALLIVEYRQRAPLSPVRRMWSTIPVIGTLVAMFAGSVFVTFVELSQRLQLETLHRSPLVTGALFSPLLAGVAVTAYLLGALLGTRFLPLLVLGGMLCLAGGGALLLRLGAGGSEGMVLAASVLLGLGAGATVSPGLYLAGLSLTSQIIGRVFALVELVRSLADYIIAPIILKVAALSSAKPPLDWDGTREGLWVTFWLALGFTAAGTLLWLAGRVGLPCPDLEAWLNKEQPAFHSPKLLARFRNK